MAFFARDAEVAGLYVAVFRDVVTNHGNAYNNKTGFFTAPLGGVYFFHLFYTIAPGGTGLSLNIVVNFLTACTANAADILETGECSAVVQLKKGDLVYVESDNGRRVISPQTQGGFSGFLYWAEAT